MCGIVGVLSTAGLSRYTNRKDWMTHALIADTVRGDDATGMFAISTIGNKDECIKGGIDGPSFVMDKSVAHVLTNIDRYTFVVGHNRAATRGGVSFNAAHPHRSGPILLVHNGTLNSWHNLPKDERNKEPVSDSKAIANAMSFYTPEDAISKLNGAFALVWYDSRDEKLRMVRNKERPLFIARVKDEDTVLFASEIHMLQWLAIKNNLKIEDYFNLTPGHLLTFNKELVSEFEVKEVELLKEQPVGKHHGTGIGTTTNHLCSSKNPLYLPFKKSASHTSSKELLAQCGINTTVKSERKKRIKFVMEKFMPYVDTYGTIRGVMLDYPYKDVEMHGVHKDNANQDYVYSGKINSAYLDGNLIVIKLDKLKIDSRTGGKALYLDLMGVSPEEEDNLTNQSDTDLPEMDLNDEEIVTGPGGVEYTRQEALHILRNGCDMCANEIPLKEFKYAKINDSGLCLCNGCIDIYDRMYGNFGFGPH